MRLPLIPTLFTIPAFIILVALGSWQLYRLEWKTHLIAEIEEKIAMPPLELRNKGVREEWMNGDESSSLAPSSLNPLLPNLKYRRITLTGHFLHDKEVHLFTGPMKMRGEAGYNILTPMELKNGEVVLVDRGWVPASQKEQENRTETLIPGEVTLTGMVMEGEKQAYFTPNNDIAKNLWFWIDMDTIAGFTGKTFGNVYVRALEEDGAGTSLPIAGQARIEIRNDHLQYVITWYSLALILLVVYWIYIKKNLGK